MNDVGERGAKLEERGVECSVSQSGINNTGFGVVEVD